MIGQDERLQVLPPDVLPALLHPDRLDPAILDRPSRFDRKYFFDLPGDAERTAYIAAWNKELQPDLRISETVAMAVVNQSEGFSFAYLKELFLSSMMDWIKSNGDPMDAVILRQVNQLTEQMKAGNNSVRDAQE